MNAEPSSLEAFLDRIHPDKSATVYVNELQLVGTMQVRRAIEAGEELVRDDVVDIHELSLNGADIPKTTGILRSRHRDVTGTANANQARLSQASVADDTTTRHACSLLLPVKFQQFLDSMYFANFDPANVQDVSRNTVAHGVAPERQMSHKAALLAILILD